MVSFEKIDRHVAYGCMAFSPSQVLILFQNKAIGYDLTQNSRFFESDKLLQVSAASSDSTAQRFLISNAVGHAYCYELNRLPTEKNVTPKRYTRAVNPTDDDYVFIGDELYYSDNAFCLRKMDLLNGKTSIVLRKDNYRILKVIKLKDHLYLLRDRDFNPMQGNPNNHCGMIIECYQIVNGVLQLIKKESDPRFWVPSFIRYDMSKNVAVVSALPIGCYHPHHITALSHHEMQLKDLDFSEIFLKYRLVHSFHTAMEYNLIVFTCSKDFFSEDSHVIICTIDTGRIMEDILIKGACDAVFLSPHSIIVASSSGVYHLELS